MPVFPHGTTETCEDCPFCGGTVASCFPANPEDIDTYYFVRCDECLAEGPLGGTRDVAVEKWNERASVALDESPWKDFNEDLPPDDGRVLIVVAGSRTPFIGTGPPWPVGALYWRPVPECPKGVE
jgi:Lar family restriction alleviation protein